LSEPVRVRFSDSPILVRVDGRAVRETCREDGRVVERDPADFLAGYRAAQDEWASRFVPLVDRFEAQLVQTETFRRDLYRTVERHVLDLALAVARKLMHQEVSEGRHRASAMIRGILRALDVDEDTAGITIRLHPDDHADILQMAREGDPWPHIEFEPDDGLDPATYEIRSEFGKVLFDLERQMADLEEYLRAGEVVS